jgi:carboxyl-terminal processing protease
VIAAVGIGQQFANLLPTDLLPTDRAVATWFVGAFSALALSACGDGGGDHSGKSSGTGYVAGVYMPATQFKGQCAAPRPGNSNDRPGSTLAENLFLRSYTNETYLWYREVPDINPAGYSTANYFNVLKTTATTASGRAKDRYHFTYNTAAWEALSQSGIEYGYGTEWMVLAGAPPRRIVVGFTYANEPASRLASPVQRGEEVRFVDGIGVDTATPDQLNAALWPAGVNETHSFTLLSTSGTTRTVTLVSEEVTLQAVQNVSTITSNTGTVGYMQFNDHLAQ